MRRSRLKTRTEYLSMRKLSVDALLRQNGSQCERIILQNECIRNAYSLLSAIKKMRSDHDGHPSVFVHFMLRFRVVYCEEPLGRHAVHFSHSPGSSFRRESAQPNNFREVFLPLPFCRVNISRTPTASAYPYLRNECPYCPVVAQHMAQLQIGSPT